MVVHGNLLNTFRRYSNILLFIDIKGNHDMKIVKHKNHRLGQLLR